MDDIILTEADGEGYAVPDTAAVEIPFDALNDTIAQEVAGNESYALTDAQRYMEGLFIANGTLRANSVSGNESFFSKVGSGARAVYDWIKKMLKSLWDFFFKRDAPKASAEAKDEVKAATDAISEASQGGSTVPKSDTILDRQIAQLEKLQSAPDANKSTVEQLLAEAKAARKGEDHTEKKRVVRHLFKEIGKVGGTHSHLQNQVDKLVRTMEHLIAYLNKEADSGATNGEEYVTFVKGFAEGMGDASNLTKLKSIKVLTDPDEAKKVLGGILVELKGIDGAVSELKREEADMHTKAKEAEKALATDATPEAKKALEALRKLVGFVTRLAKLFESIYEQSQGIGKTYRHMFGG